MFNRLACGSGLVLERPNALSARMIRNGDRHLGDVVFVIGFRQLMADSGAAGVREAARLVPRRDKPRIDRDPNYVVTGRHRRLSVAAVEQEVLPAEPPVVDIRPAFADPLIARYPDRAAAPEVWLVVGISGESLVLLHINHAEAALGRAPNEPCPGVNQFVESVMPEVIMVVATRKFEEAVAHVLVGIADNQVGVADVWRSHSKAHQRVLAGRNASLLDAAEFRRQVLDADDPMLSEPGLINDQVRQGGLFGFAFRLVG